MIASRGLWLAASLIWFWYFQRLARRVRPPALVRSCLTALVLAGIASVALSLLFSWPYIIWDRQWHIPLVASLRGQKVPFANVFGLNEMLHYHFSGDVLASTLQTLSFGVLHASYALSIAHDVVFGLTAISAALLLIHFGYRNAFLICAAVLAILLIGPVVFFRGGPGVSHEGFSILSYYHMSFRPHVNLAALLLVGSVGTVMVRLHSKPEMRAVRTVPTLLASAALLAITDEASLAIWGVALAGAWLIDPNTLLPTRRAGVLVFLGLAAAVVVPNLWFGGSLTFGGPVNHAAIVPARAQGWWGSALSLKTYEGARALAFDYAAIATTCLTLIILLARAPSRAAAASTCLAVIVATLSAVLLTKLEINGDAMQSHRFSTVALLVCPLVALFRFKDFPLHGVERPLLWGALSSAAASTLLWMQFRAPSEVFTASGFGLQNVHQMNCRRDMGGGLGDPVGPTYVSSSLWVQYTGCRPVFVPGTGSWATIDVLPATGEAAFTQLHREFLPANMLLRSICPRREQSPVAMQDPACRRALVSATCRAEGDLVEACYLTAADREAVLAQPW